MTNTCQCLPILIHSNIAVYDYIYLFQIYVLVLSISEIFKYIENRI